MTVVEDLLDDILRLSYNHAQNGIRSVLYSIVEKVVLDRLFEEVTAETLDTQLVKLLDTSAAANRLSRKLLTSSWFMSTTATFIRRETVSAIAGPDILMTKASKK